MGGSDVNGWATLSGILEPLANLLKSRHHQSGRVRREILAMLCPWWGAGAGLLIPCKGGSVQLEEAEKWGRRIEPKSRLEEMEAFLASDEDFLIVPWTDGPGRQPDLCGGAYLKLQLAGRLLGILVLRCSDSGFSPELFSTWLPVATMISQFEENQRLSRLVSSSLRRLRELTQESRRIARRNARLFQELGANQSRLRNISKGVSRMQEEERARISRELHDGLGQAMTALKINIDLIASQLGTAVSASCRDRLQETRQLAEQTISEIRQLSRLLRPRMLDDLGLSPTLRWYIRSFQKRTSVDVALADNIGEQRLAPELETLLFRVIQEGLNNIVKHSSSATAQVRLGCGPGSVEMEISDQGVGFDADRLRRSSSGLAGIEDRVALAGGEFEVDSQPGKGTTLRLRIPSKPRLQASESESPDHGTEEGGPWPEAPGIGGST